MNKDSITDAIVQAVSQQMEEFEARINERLNFILKEVGLDGIIPSTTMIKGHAVHPEVVQAFVAMSSRLSKAEVRNRELEQALLKKVLVEPGG